MVLLACCICLNLAGAETATKKDADFLEKRPRTTFGVSVLNRPDMKVSCYQDKNSGRFFLIRNKREVEVSELSWLDVPSEAKGKRFNFYLAMGADSGAFLYKEILLVADVFSKSFPDRKSAEECGRVSGETGKSSGRGIFFLDQALLA